MGSAGAVVGAGAVSASGSKMVTRPLKRPEHRQARRPDEGSPRRLVGAGPRMASVQTAGGAGAVAATPTGRRARPLFVHRCRAGPGPGWSAFGRWSGPGRWRQVRRPGEGPHRRPFVAAGRGQAQDGQRSAGGRGRDSASHGDRAKAQAAVSSVPGGGGPGWGRASVSQRLQDGDQPVRRQKGRQVRRLDEAPDRCPVGARRGQAQDGQRWAGGRGRGGQGEGDSYPTGWQYLAIVHS